jgi:hypothetical protein
VALSEPTGTNIDIFCHSLARPKPAAWRALLEKVS